MAVNENLYNWMLKTYGMGAAEWYRSNPTKPSGANPFLPKGAYVPLAQKNAPGAKGPRGETLASVSPDIIEESIIEPAPKAPAETEDQKFERYYNQAKQQYEESNKGKPTYTAQEFPSAKLGPNITYMPNYGQYGGYFSKEDLGYNLSSNLYKRYQEAVNKIPLPYEDDYGQVGYRALYGTSPGGNAENYQKVLENEKARQARQQAFQDLYQKPLEAAKYKSVTDAPSRAAYRQQLVDLGFEIPLVQGDYSYFERAATAEDYEPQYYGLQNVGREDYRQQRANSAIAKNFEILEQQAASGNQSSQAFLDKYRAESEAPIGESEPVRGPRGEEMGEVASILPPAMSQAELYRAIQEYSRPGGPAKGSELRDLQQEWIRRQKLKGAEVPGTGPRGEDLIAQNQGPSTPVKYDENMNMFVPNQGGGRPTNIRLKNPPVREAQAPAFDEQKALIAAQAAGSYRNRGDVEDPFRSAAFG